MWICLLNHTMLCDEASSDSLLWRKRTAATAVPGRICQLAAPKVAEGWVEHAQTNGRQSR